MIDQCARSRQASGTMFYIGSHKWLCPACNDEHERELKAQRKAKARAEKALKRGRKR